MQWEQIIAACVTGLLAFLGVIWQSRKTRRINTGEHSETAVKLDRIEKKVDSTAERVETVSDRLDDHVVLHSMTTRKPWWRK